MKRFLTVFVCTGVLVAWFFAPALSGKSSFAFRDAAHYYHPLFEYLRGEWLSGRAPLWNPYENIGVPLVAQNTSSVFYPGQLLFALPLEYTLLYNLYVVLHVVLAVASGFGLARYLRAGPLGAGLGAVSYAFSGSVLFQYCNVVFLVGAAWLPLAVLLADRMLRRRHVGSAVGFGAVLALMVLGGDPQMAYNAVLLAALLALMLWRADKRGAPPADGAVSGGVCGRRIVLVGISLVAAGALAAVQVLPTLEAAPHSRRALYDAPRSLDELAWSLVAATPREEQVAWYDGLLGRGSGGHQQEVYQFSVAPWRIVELAWPNVTGRAFPTNRRWLQPLGVEPDAWDLWTPTLYMGLLPFVLAAAAWTVRRSAPLEIRFLSWMVVFGAAASLGGYGIGWAVEQAGGNPNDVGIGSEVGGFYWLLTVLLPKYVYFRYPAKWFVVASLGLSMLAACGWEGAWQANRRRVRRWFAVIFVLSLLGFGATLVGWNAVERHAAETPPAPILGPFDWAGARRDLLTAWLHSAVLSLVFLGVFRLAGARPRLSDWTRVAAFAVTALDLAVAQSGLVLYAPAEDWKTEPKVMDKLPAGLAGYRVFRQRGPLAPSWERTFSADRFAECVRWDRETLLPKYPLPYGVSLVEATETIAFADYLVLLDVARGHNARAGTSRLPDAAILDLLGARVAIVAREAGGQVPSTEDLAEGMVIGVRPHALERAWIVHRIDVLREYRGHSLRRLRERTQDVLFPDGGRRDWRSVAVVETDEAIGLAARNGGSPAEETCTMVYGDPQRVEIDATLAADGLVVLADLFYPGWELSVETGGETRPVPILRTNRVMRGALLPAGRHRLVYRYRPTSVLWGGAISGASAMLLAVAVIYAGVRQGTQRNGTAKGTF